MRLTWSEVKFVACFVCGFMLACAIVTVMAQGPLETLKHRYERAYMKGIALSQENVVLEIENKQLKEGICAPVYLDLQA